MKKIIVIFFICCSFFESKAQQTAYKEVKIGNQAYMDSSFQKAELSYRKGIDINNKAAIPQYNLGNTKYAQKDYEAAAQQFETSAELFEGKKDKASAYHNKGNALLEQDKYEAAIAEYKKALKLFPLDMDTKYNLAYAQEKLKKEQEQQQQNQQEENKEDKKDEEKEQKDNKDEKGEDKKDKEGKDKEDKEGEQKEDNEKPGDKEGLQDNKQQKKPGELSKEDAEQLLNSINAKEGKLKEKLDQPKDTIYISTDKDW